MLFSIVVPVYNVEKYIKECLESLVNQSFQDFEIIVVDDGSTDSCGKICDEYAFKHNKIKVIHKQNEGLLLARRTGIKECKGDYILHCDSDDYVTSNMLQEIKEVINEYHPDMVMYGYNIVNNEHEVLERHYTLFDQNEYFDKANKEVLIKTLVSTTWLNTMWTKATKRDCVDIDANYEDFSNIKMGEDVLQVIPLFKNSYSFVYIAKPVYVYRFNNMGMSKQANYSYLGSHISISTKMHDYLLTENVSEKTFILFYNRFIKDIYKYLLRFIKAKINKKEFLKCYKIATENDIYVNALNAYNKWDFTNRLLKRIVKPKFWSALQVFDFLVPKI